MVRHVLALTALLVACISTVSALPAPARHETAVACAPPHVQALGPNSVAVCSPSSTKPAPSTQTLERRAGKSSRTPAQRKASKKKAVVAKKAAGIKVPTNRKARAKDRVAKGKPKATAKDKGRVPGVARTKLKPAMTAKKVAKVAERKENRKLGKQQKFAGKVAEAKQKQRAPLYGIDQTTGALRKPQKEDMATKAWGDKQKAQTDKAARTAAYHAMSPADKTAKQDASKAKQKLKQDADKAGSVKDKNRRNRVTAKAKANTQRKTGNRNNANTAKAAYSTAQGLPTRGATYISPKGNAYNGKDVRQAVYASEYGKAHGGLGFNKNTGKQAKQIDKLPKNFENRQNKDKSIPLPGAGKVGLSEFPILHNKQNGHDGRRPAPTADRIITKENASGQTELVGKVGHAATGDDHHSF